MLESVGQFLEEIGSDKLVVGIATLFGVLTGVEFLLRYLGKTAALASWLARRGAQKLARRAKRAFQEDLVMVRRLRSEAYQEVARANVRHNTRTFAIFSAFFILIAVGAGALIDDAQNRAAWIGTALGMATRHLFGFFASVYSYHRLKRTIADPAAHRTYVLRSLRRLRV